MRQMKILGWVSSATTKGADMNIKAELKHAESELKNAYKTLKELGIKNPKSFVRDSCGYNIEDELGYAQYQIGKIEILKRLARKASPRENA